LAAAEAAAAAAAPVCNDTAAPTVSIRFDVSPKTYLTEFRAIVAFSEPVLGFNAATALSVSGANVTYIATVTSPFPCKPSLNGTTTAVLWLTGASVGDVTVGPAHGIPFSAQPDCRYTSTLNCYITLVHCTTLVYYE
jgi:hypothetical protein